MVMIPFCLMDAKPLLTFSVLLLFPQPTRNAPAMPGPSGDGAADPLQSRRQLQAAAEGEEGDADHPT